MPEVSAVPVGEARRFRLPAQSLVMAALLLLLVLLQQWHASAYTHEIGGDPDEPAHYVTGLLFHDYIGAGLPAKPMGYAENYYLHYPKIALGHWPPMFYVVQTLWTVPFGISRVSVILFMALLGGAFLAVLVQRAIAEKYGQACGLLAGCLLLALPVMEYAETRVMSESLEALLCFAALRCWGSNLKSPTWRASLGFFRFHRRPRHPYQGATDLLLVKVVPLDSRSSCCAASSVFAKPFILDSGPGDCYGLPAPPTRTLLPNTGMRTLRAAEGVRLNWDGPVLLPFRVDVISQMGPLAALLIAVGFLVWLWQAIRGEGPDEQLTAAGCVILGFFLILPRSGAGCRRKSAISPWWRHR